MGAVYPKDIRADEDDEQKEMAFEYQETLAAPGNGDWIMFPDGVNGASVELEVTAGEGYVEATLASLQDVKTGATVTGKKWDLSNVVATTQDYCLPCTAIRQVNVSGTTKIKVRMQ